MQLVLKMHQISVLLIYSEFQRVFFMCVHICEPRLFKG